MNWDSVRKANDKFYLFFNFFTIAKGTKVYKTTKCINKNDKNRCVLCCCIAYCVCILNILNKNNLFLSPYYKTNSWVPRTKITFV